MTCKVKLVLCAMALTGGAWAAGAMNGESGVPETQEFRLYIPSGNNSFVPRFQRGFVLWKHPKTAAGPDITIRSLDGSEPLEIKVEAEGALETYPQSVSPFPGGRGFVIAAATKNLDGRRSLWLLFYSPKGERLKQVKITPFHVGQLTVADDGTIWAFGQHSIQWEDPDSPEPTLYQFSAEGTVLRRLLPRNQIEGPEPPCNGADPFYGYCEIHAAKDRVVAYAPRAELVIEWNSQTGTLQTYKVARPAGLRGQPLYVDKVAVTDSGEILASAGGRIYWLDREQRKWIPVEKDALPPRTSRLFGASGDFLLVNGDSSDPFRFRLMRWAKEGSPAAESGAAHSSR